MHQLLLQVLSGSVLPVCAAPGWMGQWYFLFFRSSIFSYRSLPKIFSVSSMLKRQRIYIDIRYWGTPFLYRGLMFFVLLRCCLSGCPLASLLCYFRVSLMLADSLKFLMLIFTSDVLLLDRSVGLAVLVLHFPKVPILPPHISIYVFIYVYRYYFN